MKLLIHLAAGIICMAMVVLILLLIILLTGRDTVKLGFIPSVLVTVVTIKIDRMLCEKWDERQRQ